MKKNFKVFSLVMALLLMLGMLAACTSASPAPTTAAPADTKAAATTEATKAPEATPTPEAVKLTLGMPNVGRDESPAGSGEYPDDNWATRFIIEKFAKANNVDMKFQLIDDTNDSFTQNYLLLMASQKAPDLAYVPDAICLNLANNEALADYQASLDKYGANLVKFLGADFIKNRGTFNGKLVTIPGKEDIPAISHYWIRKDWCDTLGLKVPTNFDEWYATMKAFKDRAAELEAAGRVKKAADVIPYAMYHTKYFTDWERIVVTNYPVKYFDPKNMDYYCYSGYGLEYMKEGFKEGFQFMNQMYKEGLISPNFALDSEQAEFDRAIAAGNAGSYCNNLFDGWSPNDPNAKQNLLKQNIPNAEFVYCDCFTNKFDSMKRNPLDYDVLTHIVTPYFSKAVDQAIMYLDFIATDNNMITIQFGEEGVTYTMDEAVGPISKGADAVKAWGHQLGGRYLVMIGRLPNRDWSVALSAGAANKEQAAEAVQLCNEIEKNGYFRFPVELTATPERGTYYGALRPVWQKFLSNLIMAEDGKFEEVWTAGVKELEDTGSKALYEAYIRDLTKMGYAFAK